MEADEGADGAELFRLGMADREFLEARGEGRQLSDEAPQIKRPELGKGGEGGQAFREFAAAVFLGDDVEFGEDAPGLGEEVGRQIALVLSTWRKRKKEGAGGGAGRGSGG